jgi:hypothetical protein
LRSIRRRRRGYVLLLTVSLCLTMGSAVGFKTGVTFVFGATVIISLILLAKQNRLLHQAALIWDNPILLVSYDTAPIRQEEEATIVSTFGLWDGVKIHEWGRRGMRGIRLTSMGIHKTRINLSFGNVGETTWAELMHGITDLQEVLDVKERLWRETGVIATIVDW